MLQRLQPRPLRRAPGPATCVLLAVLSAGCRTPEEHRLAADDEVYEIVAARREQLSAGGAFSIDAPPDALRGRLVAAAAAGEPLELEPLGFLESLSIAAENSRDYQQQREELYLTALDLTLERWRFGVQLDGTVIGAVDGDGGDGENASVAGGLGFSKLFGTGALVVGNIGLDFFRALSSGDGWDAVSGASLAITQPLLRGFGSEIVLEPLTQAERNVLYQARDYERFRRTFAFEVAARMFRIAQQVDTLGNEEQNFASLVVIRERNEAFAEAGQLLDIEVDQALQDELRARTRVVEAQRTLDALYDDFKLFLGLPVETGLRIRDEELEQLFGLVVPVVEFDEELAAGVALARRLDHQTEVERLGDAERFVVIAEDALRAGLNLNATVNAASQEGQPLVFEDTAVPWAASLELDLPIDRLPERNAYRTALVGRELARRSAEESADFVRSDVRAALRELEAAREQVDIQANAVILAERRVESSRMQQEAGRADTRDLLESQEALVEAKNAEVAARVDYTLARLALYRDMELLRVDEGGLRVELEPLTVAEDGS
jgi:outer membrane protein TolC